MAKTKPTPSYGERDEPTRARDDEATIPLPPTNPLPFPVEDPPVPPDVPYLVEDDEDEDEPGADDVHGDDINGDDEDKDDGNTRQGANEESV